MEDQFDAQIGSDRDVMDRPVMSNLTGDELQVIRQLCEIANIHSAFDSNNEIGVVTGASYMEDAELGPNEFQNSFNKCSADPGSTYDSATPITNYDGIGIHGANDEVVIEFRDATDLFSNNCVRTQVQNMKEAAHKQRVEEIAADLMSCEQIKNTQIPDNIFLQPGVELSNPTTQTFYQSNMSGQYEEVDLGTTGSIIGNAMEMTDNGRLINQCSSGRASDELLNNECRLITSEDTTNNRTEIMDYTTSIVNFNENLLNQDSEQNTPNTGERVEQYGASGSDHICEIHSVGVRDEPPLSKEPDNLPNTDWEPDNIMNLGAPQPNTSKTMEIMVSDSRNILGPQVNLPNTADYANTGDSTEKSTITATKQDEDTMKRHTRSSNRSQRYACYSNSREKILRTRYPDLSELRKQAENNCPDLDNPFWENIETFSCKRSVFYRKKSSVICHLSFFKEIHEPMGFKIDSKHVLIKSNKNPQMPICVSCHSSHCEVKEAVKCGYCVKAYFELMCESELGDRREVIDKWD
ncbi:hypothetical protein QAD02_002846 [Eretmocerus hayati]|uniref:Uncharacterized protein n=1 Tax=Eretmocerus hayati TaxID=131215 RepID=A0ACC2NKF8_9HYME|nr:hypothetical protein QAD02_002846 [Eretmocerus hayati]